MNHFWTDVTWKKLGIQYRGGLTHLKRKSIHLMNMQEAHCTCGKHNFLRQRFIINNRELRQLNVVHPRHWTSSLPVELNVICSVAIWETKEGQKHSEIHINSQNSMLAQSESRVSRVPTVCVVSGVNQHVIENTSLRGPGLTDKIVPADSPRLSPGEHSTAER